MGTRGSQEGADVVVRREIEQNPRWRFDAACRGADPSLFFAPNYFEKRHEKAAREAVARRICERCPVRAECLEFALEVRDPHGFWGGLNELERRQLLRERSRRAG